MKKWMMYLAGGAVVTYFAIAHNKTLGLVVGAVSAFLTYKAHEE